MFKNFARSKFPEAFEKSCNPKKKLFVQDGDQSQNSKKAHIAFDEISCTVFLIPARSPDINPIENVFNVIREHLKKDAFENEIKKESFEEFSVRVKASLLQFPSDIIDKTVDSMMKRMNQIKKGKGHCIKY